MRTERAVVNKLALPAGSTARALIACSPSASGAVGRIDQAPAALALPLPIADAPSYSVTVVPASAVPVNHGVVTRVTLSSGTPLSVPAARSGTLGAAGAVVS